MNDKQTTNQTDGTLPLNLKVRDFTELSQPYLHASVRGRAVRLMAFGDAEGKSPAFLTIGQNGLPVWESITDCLIIDPTARPLDQEAFQTMINTGAQGTGGSNPNPSTRR